jgi:hypothetical protein
MPPGPHHDIVLDDAALEGGEWLFRRGSDVCGPLSSREVAAMLYRGALSPETPVSAGDGRWTPVGQVPIFLVHARRAAAALKVEREVTGARALARRRSRARTVAVVLVVVLLVGAGVYLGVWASRRGAPDMTQLEDFGSGIRVASVAKVGVSRRPAEEEIEVPLEPDVPGRPRAPARSPAGAAGGSGAVGGGDLVVAQFDERRIQAVVVREQRGLAACFRAEADRSPEFRGDIPFEFAIGNDGRVVELWIDDPRFKQGPLRTCLLEKLRGWRFDPFPGQRPTVQLAFHVGQ